MTPAEIAEDFLFTYAGWLDSGAVEGQPFTRGDDLEQNMVVALNKVMDPKDPMIQEARGLLRDLFRSQGLDAHFPWYAEPGIDVHDYMLNWLGDLLEDKFYLNKEMRKWISEITSQ